MQIGPIEDVTKLPIIGSDFVQSQLVTGPKGALIVSNFEGDLPSDLHEFGVRRMKSGLTLLMEATLNLPRHLQSQSQNQPHPLSFSSSQPLSFSLSASYMIILSASQLLSLSF